MQLKLDAVRDVMLFLEQHLEVYEDSNRRIKKVTIMMKQVANDTDLNQKYLYKDIIYTIMKLSESGYINCIEIPVKDWVEITDITFRGHEFLNTIRDERVFKKASSKLSALASVPLAIFQDVATQTMISFIEEKISL